MAVPLHQTEMDLLVLTRSLKKVNDILLPVVPTGRAVSAKQALNRTACGNLRTVKGTTPRPLPLSLVVGTPLSL